MTEAKRRFLRRFCTAAALFMLAGVFRQLDSLSSALSFHPELLSAMCFLMTNLLYIGLACAWGMSLHRRILNREVRRYLMLSCAMVLLWLLLRTMKYRFFEEDLILRHLWYLYYVPQILAPLFGFFAALQLGQRESAALPRRWKLLFIPACLLIAGILTNDLHQLAFRFAPDWANWDSDYRHGPLYALAIGWMFFFMLTTVGVIRRKCRISESRRRAWIPISVFTAGAALCLLSHLNIYTFHKLPECCCLTFAGLWESCLQIGLLPTNNRYQQFFSASTLSAQIADRQGQVLYRASTAPELAPEQMRAAAEGPVFPDADTRLNSAPIHNGRVYWLENLSGINRAKEQLEEIRAQLMKENGLIRAEAELRRQQAQIEEKIRLYDRISRILKPQLDRMDALLDGDAPQNIRLVCILGAYVKRRGNLALICGKEALLSTDELAYCIRESLIDLTAYGVVCSFHQKGKGLVSGAQLQAAYDFFESALEAALPTLSALLVRVEYGGCLSVRLMMEDAKALPDPAPLARAGQLSVDQTDGTLCLTLALAKEVS